MIFQISDVFNELLFGSGAWIGLIILLILCLAGTFMFKYAGTIFGTILVFLGILYLQNVEQSSYFIFSVLICWVTAFFAYFKVIEEAK